MFSKDQIRSELQLRVRLVMRLLPYFKESTFGKVNNVLDKTLKGRWPGKNSVCEERMIKREDGSDLRILVVTPKPVSAATTCLRMLRQRGQRNLPAFRQLLHSLAPSNLSTMRSKNS